MSRSGPGWRSPTCSARAASTGSYLLVAGTTGTGWVDPAAINSFEYETGGDSAAVAIQYSYLPSWASFLVDQAKAREAGRALFDEVYRVWSELPASRAPEAVRVRVEPWIVRDGDAVRR